MRECDIWADREPSSCGGAPVKSPLKPFVHFSLENEKRRSDLAVCVRIALYCYPAGGGKESDGGTLNTFVFERRQHSFAVPEECVIGAARFQRDVVTDFMANVDVHLISHS